MSLFVKGTACRFGIDILASVKCELLRFITVVADGIVRCVGNYIKGSFITATCVPLKLRFMTPALLPHSFREQDKYTDTAEV